MPPKKIVPSKHLQQNTNDLVLHDTGFPKKKSVLSYWNNATKKVADIKLSELQQNFGLYISFHGRVQVTHQSSTYIFKDFNAFLQSPQSSDFKKKYPNFPKEPKAIHIATKKLPEVQLPFEIQNPAKKESAPAPLSTQASADPLTQEEEKLGSLFLEVVKKHTKNDDVATSYHARSIREAHHALIDPKQASYSNVSTHGVIQDSVNKLESGQYYNGNKLTSEDSEGIELFQSEGPRTHPDKFIEFIIQNDITDIVAAGLPQEDKFKFQDYITNGLKIPANSDRPTHQIIKIGESQYKFIHNGKEQEISLIHTDELLDGTSAAQITPENLEKLVTLMKEAERTDGPPKRILSHCSAGIGRSASINLAMSLCKIAEANDGQLSLDDVMLNWYQFNSMRQTIQTDVQFAGVLNLARRLYELKNADTLSWTDEFKWSDTLGEKCIIMPKSPENPVDSDIVVTGFNADHSMQSYIIQKDGTCFKVNYESGNHEKQDDISPVIKLLERDALRDNKSILPQVILQKLSESPNADPNTLAGATEHFKGEGNRNDLIFRVNPHNTPVLTILDTKNEILELSLERITILKEGKVRIELDNGIYEYDSFKSFLDSEQSASFIQFESLKVFPSQFNVEREIVLTNAFIAQAPEKFPRVAASEEAISEKLTREGLTDPKFLAAVLDTVNPNEAATILISQNRLELLEFKSKSTADITSALNSVIQRDQSAKRSTHDWSPELKEFIAIEKVIDKTYEQLEQQLKAYESRDPSKLKPNEVDKIIEIITRYRIKNLLIAANEDSEKSVYQTYHDDISQYKEATENEANDLLKKEPFVTVRQSHSEHIESEIREFLESIHTESIQDILTEDFDQKYKEFHASKMQSAPKEVEVPEVPEVPDTAEPEALADFLQELKGDTTHALYTWIKKCDSEDWSKSIEALKALGAPDKISSEIQTALTEHKDPKSCAQALIKLNQQEILNDKFVRSCLKTENPSEFADKLIQLNQKYKDAKFGEIKNIKHLKTFLTLVEKTERQFIDDKLHFDDFNNLISLFVKNNPHIISALSKSSDITNEAKIIIEKYEKYDAFESVEDIQHQILSDKIHEMGTEDEEEQKQSLTADQENKLIHQLSLNLELIGEEQPFNRFDFESSFDDEALQRTFEALANFLAEKDVSFDDLGPSDFEAITEIYEAFVENADFNPSEILTEIDKLHKVELVPPEELAVPPSDGPASTEDQEKNKILIELDLGFENTTDKTALQQFREFYNPQETKFSTLIDKINAAVAEFVEMDPFQKDEPDFSNKAQTMHYMLLHYLASMLSQQQIEQLSENQLCEIHKLISSAESLENGKAILYENIASPLQAEQGSVAVSPEGVPEGKTGGLPTRASKKTFGQTTEQMLDAKAKAFEQYYKDDDTVRVSRDETDKNIEIIQLGADETTPDAEKVIRTNLKTGKVEAPKVKVSEVKKVIEAFILANARPQDVDYFIENGKAPEGGFKDRSEKPLEITKLNTTVKAIEDEAIKVCKKYDIKHPEPKVEAQQQASLDEAPAVQQTQAPLQEPPLKLISCEGQKAIIFEDRGNEISIKLGPQIQTIAEKSFERLNEILREHPDIKFVREPGEPGNFKVMVGEEVMYDSAAEGASKNFQAIVDLISQKAKTMTVVPLDQKMRTQVQEFKVSEGFMHFDFKGKAFHVGHSMGDSSEVAALTEKLKELLETHGDRIELGTKNSSAVAKLTVKIDGVEIEDAQSKNLKELVEAIDTAVTVEQTVSAVQQ